MGVSYIPWSKLKPELDFELVEEGGMMDEDTMPEWLKTKMAETTSKKQLVTASAAEGATDRAGFIPLPDGTPATGSVGTPTTTVDTSQPPPLHTSGLLPPPPMAMPLVSPFSLNTRLLGPMGAHMSLPPGLMPNVPIGVPPPNLPGALMSNQLLGIGSPFTQAPPGMMPPMPMSNSGDKPPLLPPPNGSNDASNDINFGQSNMNALEDNMDIEMEDAEKTDKQLPLSDQLLAAISGPPFGNDNRFNEGHDDKRNRDRDSRTRDRNDRRDNRPRRNSRDRGRDRDGRENRDRDRDGSRRGNRWSDNRDYRGRDRNDRDRDSDREKKSNDQPRGEKSLAERLRDMAHEGIVPNREQRSQRDRSEDKPPAPFNEERAFPPGTDAPSGAAERTRDSNDRHADRPRDNADRPRDNADRPPRDNTDRPARDNVDRPPRDNMDRPPRDNIDRPPRDLDRPPRDLDRPPRENMDRPPRDNMDRSQRDMDRPPRDIDRPPRDLDRPPRDMDRPPRDNMDRPPRDNMDRPPREGHENARRMDDISWRDPRHPEEIFRQQDFPMDDFDPRMRRHPDDFPRMDHPDFDPRMAHGDFDGRRAPPPHPFADEMRMDPEQYEYEMRQREKYDRREFRGGAPGPDDMRRMDEFDPRGRGPEFYPRDGFGPRPPMMRGPGGDGFPPRPLLGRPPGPPMFHPRGMGSRGPRPGMYFIRN